MTATATRAHLRRQLEAHLTELGYSSVRTWTSGSTAPEIIRVNPVGGRLAYGETVLRRDLRSRRCHERLRDFSQRRTRQRSSILFFIGVSEADQQELEELLEELAIRGTVRGGHVHVVPITPPAAAAARRGSRRQRA